LLLQLQNFNQKQRNLQVSFENT